MFKHPLQTEWKGKWSFTSTIGMAGIARAWSRDWQTYQYRQHGRHRYAFDNTYSSTRWTVHGDTRVREAVALRDY